MTPAVRIAERIEHDLKIEGGAADDLDHVGGRVLLRRPTSGQEARQPVAHKRHLPFHDATATVAGAKLASIDLAIAGRQTAR
jgi:hypothetical protein